MFFLRALREALPRLPPWQSKRKQRGDKQEQAGGAQCTEAPVSFRGLGILW
jgi:hypothetical protein